MSKESTGNCPAQQFNPSPLREASIQIEFLAQAQAGGLEAAWNPSAYWAPVRPEKGVCGHPCGSEGSFKGGFQLWQRQILRATLGLLDSPFSFRQYTIAAVEHVLSVVGCLLDPPAS